MLRTEMPESIRLPTGEVLKPVIGGHLENKPFLTKIDVKQNGWMDRLIGSEEEIIIAEAKQRKLKYRRVSVLSRNLRRSVDLHGRPYRPTRWVFVQVPANWSKKALTRGRT